MAQLASAFASSHRLGCVCVGGGEDEIIGTVLVANWPNRLGSSNVSV